MKALAGRLSFTEYRGSLGRDDGDGDGEPVEFDLHIVEVPRMGFQYRASLGF